MAKCIDEYLRDKHHIKRNLLLFLRFVMVQVKTRVWFVPFYGADLASGL